MQFSIVSQLPPFAGKAVHPYEINGIDTVGLFGDEPYQLVFRNSSRDRVEVIFSIDGINVLTGAPASLADQHRLVVSGYGTTELNAWPETNRSGPRFVFHGVEPNVALLPSGDAGGVGYLSAAVFVEDREAAFQGTPPYYKHGGTTTVDKIYGAARTMPSVRDIPRIAAATGAGEQVPQRIRKAPGLFRAKHTQTLQLRYLWWDDLFDLMQERGVSLPRADRRVMDS